MTATATAAPTNTSVLDQLIATKLQLAQLEDQQKALLAQLSDAYEMGLISDKLTHNGWSISWSPGRKAYDYPDDVIAMEADLQAAKQAAVASKRATPKPSSPYWSVRAPRPGKDA
jgi:beta-lactamase class A